jgi:hypothetical protein
MYCEKTGQGRYALQDLNIHELNLLKAALAVAKQKEFNNPEKHASERLMLDNIYSAINHET